MPPAPCIVCSQPLADHETQTCSHCITQARRNLIDIEQDYMLLEAELLDRAGAATPPDPTGVRADNSYMPGGDILVMLGPGSTGWHETEPVDVDSVLGVLERYDRDWRITFHELAAQDAPTVSGVTLYLLRHLAKAAAEHPTFQEFHQDMRIMRSWLELALRNGPQRSPVPCLNCGRRALERPLPREDGVEVEWQCSHCHRNYRLEDYYLAVRQSGQAV